jgi:hypothetical protein
MEKFWETEYANECKELIMNFSLEKKNHECGSQRGKTLF